MNNQQTEQGARKALAKHLEGNELFKDVVWVVFTVIFCAYSLNYLIN